eukprot:1515498-Amphidinium_carterae.1
MKDGADQEWSRTTSCESGLTSTTAASSDYHDDDSSASDIVQAPGTRLPRTWKERPDTQDTECEDSHISSWLVDFNEQYSSRKIAEEP